MKKNRTVGLLLLVGLSLISCSKGTLERKFNDNSWGELYKTLYDLGADIYDLQIAYLRGPGFAYDSNDESLSVSAVGGFRGDDKFTIFIVEIANDKMVEIKDEFVSDLPETPLTIQEYGETKSFPFDCVDAQAYLKNDSFSYLSVANSYEGYGRSEYRLLAKTPSGNKTILNNSKMVNSMEVNDILVPCANHCLIYGDSYLNENLELEYTVKDSYGCLRGYLHRRSYGESQYIGNYAFEYEKGKFLLTFFTPESNHLVFHAEIVDIINDRFFGHYSTVVVEGKNKYSKALFSGVDSDGNYKFEVEYVTYEGISKTYNCSFNPVTAIPIKATGLEKLF